MNSDESALHVILNYLNVSLPELNIPLYSFMTYYSGYIIYHHTINNGQYNNNNNEHLINNGYTTNGCGVLQL